jgi:hypothetical protein
MVEVVIRTGKALRIRQKLQDDQNCWTLEWQIGGGGACKLGGS